MTLRSLIQHPRVRRHAPKFLRFAIVGGTGAFIDLTTLHVFVQYLQMSEYLAPICSTLISVTFVFLANKFFTFRDQEKRYAGQVAKFAMVYGIAITANIATTTFLIWLGVHYLLAKVIAIGLGVFWNYAMSHGFIFRKQKDIEVVAV